MTTDPLDRVRAEARKAMAQAYAPYSGFKVGAALLCADHTVVAGCNVESASYPVGICAERSALGAAITRGMREFRAIVIMTDAVEPTAPCGMCRQALAEFAPDLAVISRTSGGREMQWSLAELLPRPFTPSSLPSGAGLNSA
ncbi:MAG: cytidine deaminase [Gemmatimonadetes bacterium]|nr:cytidine deaminase [Gemmatimonadota bacterium]